MEAAPESQLTVPRQSTGRVRPVLSVALALAAGLALRLWMMAKFFEVTGDSLIYGGLAKNLLLRGSYTLTTAAGATYPTLIRLPGYPLFLAACFRAFGMENYASAAWVQIALELLGCLLLADFVRRIASPAAAHCTLWLAVLCPFTAIYAGQPMAESPTLFVLVLALWAAAHFCEHPGWPGALWFTFAITVAALLRPDGVLVGVALLPALLVGLRWNRVRESRDELVSHGNERALKGRWKALSQRQKVSGHDLSRAAASSVAERTRTAESSFPQRLNRLKKNPRWAEFCNKAQLQLRHDTAPGPHLSCEPPKFVRMAIVCLFLALVPFAVWTVRNWQVFHVFQPLAPRLATDPGEDQHLGWENWIKSWCLDFASTYDIYWNVPGGPLDLTKLPSRAFDSPAQYAETAALATDYNRNQVFTPEIDGRFGRLAEERRAAHPLRSYVWLPMGRLADMWLRPRVENLPIDLDWWVYAHHRAETRFSWAYAGLNAVYLLLGIAGLCLRPRFWPWMLAYLALRSALLLTVEAPETRYTLECFPILFALGGVALGAGRRRMIGLKRG